jgi:hypothetical protein
MFRALLAHPQEALHKRHLVYRTRIVSVDCGTVQDVAKCFNVRLCYGCLFLFIAGRHFIFSALCDVAYKPLTLCSLLFYCGLGSSVGIATGHGLDGPGIESR